MFKPRADDDQTDFALFEDPEDISFVKMVPQAIFVMLVLVVVTFTLYDVESVIDWFELFVDFVRSHPYKSGAYIVLLIALLIVFMLPIIWISIAIAYGLGKAFPNAYWYSFGYGFVLILAGVVIGTLTTFLISKYTRIINH
jgi:hypothetical protein